MKREDNNALSRALILDAAMREFSARGYEGASLNTAWAEKGISKGVIYYHFKDKDEIYLLCVKRCFEALTAHLQATAAILTGTPETRLEVYFDARARFFADKPLYLGIFCDAVVRSPAALATAVADCRRDFDALNIAVLTDLLHSAKLRAGMRVETIVEDFRVYMDFFNLRFKTEWERGCAPEQALRVHEEQCHRQLRILLYGVVTSC